MFPTNEAAPKDRRTGKVHASATIHLAPMDVGVTPFFLWPWWEKIDLSDVFWWMAVEGGAEPNFAF